MQTESFQPLWCAAGIAAALVAVPVHAQPRVDTPGGAASPIVVTGRGLDQTDSTPTRPAIEVVRERAVPSASGRLEDVLAIVAGVQQFRRADSRSANPTAQGVTMRGLGGNATSRALVLLDAVPMTDPFFGHVPFSAMPWERLERITLTRGGSSAAFGAGAVAGTVALESAGADQLGLIEAAVAANDRGESELSVTAAPQLGPGFAVISARWDRGQGFWTTPAAQRGSASVRARHQSWSAALRAVAPIAPDVELQARVLLYDDHRTLRFAGADTATRGQDASLRLVGRGAWQIDLLGYVQARDFSNVVISATSLRRTLDQRATPATGLGGKLELRPPIAGHYPLRAGIDWRRAAGDMREDAYSAGTGQITARRRAGGTNDDLGLFAEADLRWGPARLTLGGRADRWALRRGYFQETAASGLTTGDLHFADRSGWAASLHGALSINLGAGLSLRGAAYQGLRLPTLNELYRPFVVFPVTTRANAGLTPERLEGAEIGADFMPHDNLQVQVTLFDNRVKQAIANVTIGPNLRERRNVGAVASRGIEASAMVGLGQLRVTGSLSLLDARLVTSGTSAALDGLRPAQVPAFAAAATLAWRPGRDWLVSATVRHSGQAFEDDLQTDLLPPATTLDAVVSIPLGGRLALVLRGENLLDEAVVTRSQAGSIDLGAPRTVWAGLKFTLPR